MMKDLLKGKLLAIGQRMYQIQREEMQKANYPLGERDPRISQLKAQHSLVVLLIKLFEPTKMSTQRSRPQGQ